MAWLNTQWTTSQLIKQVVTDSGMALVSTLGHILAFCLGPLRLPQAFPMPYHYKQ